MGKMRQSFPSFPIRARYQIIYLVRSLQLQSNKSFRRSVRNLQTQRFKVKLKILSILFVATAYAVAGYAFFLIFFKSQF
jgi:hypothetical protein